MKTHLRKKALSSLLAILMLVSTLSAGLATMMPPVYAAVGDDYDITYIFRDDFNTDKVQYISVGIPHWDGTSPGYTMPSQDENNGSYYSLFWRFGRWDRAAVSGRGNVWSAAYGFHPRDGSNGVEAAPYDIKTVLAVGKTVDSNKYKPTGNPNHAERELYVSFSMRTNYNPHATIAAVSSPLPATPAYGATNKIGTGKVFSLLGYKGDGGGRTVFAGMELRYSDDTEGALELWMDKSDGNGMVLVDVSDAKVMAYPEKNGEGVYPPAAEGQWHDIDIHAGMDDTGSNENGFLQVSIDGTVEFELTGLNWYDAEYGFNDVGLYASLTHPDDGGPILGEATRQYDDFTVARVPNPEDYNPNNVTMWRFHLDNGGKRQQELTSARTEYDIIMEPGATEFKITPYVNNPDAFITIGADPTQYKADGTDTLSIPIAAVSGDPKVARRATLVFTVHGNPGTGGVTKTYTFNVECVKPYRVVEDVKDSWLWWDDFSNHEANASKYFQGGGSSSANNFFWATRGTGLGGNYAMEAKVKKGDISRPSLQLALGPVAAGLGTAMTRPDGQPAVYEPTNTYSPETVLPQGYIDDMYVRFYLKQDQELIGGQDKLMRFTSLESTIDLNRSDIVSAVAALNPAWAKPAGSSGQSGTWSQPFIGHIWSMGGDTPAWYQPSADQHPHWYLGADPASGIDVPGSGTTRLLRGTPDSSWTQMQIYEWAAKRYLIQNGLNYGSGTTVPGDKSHFLTNRYNDFDWLNWLGSSTGGGSGDNVPIFSPDHTGEWYCIEQRLKLNTPGLSDGIMQLWIDGVLVVSRTGLDLRGSYIGKGITHVFIENYCNNGYTADASRYISNLVVSTDYIGPATFDYFEGALKDGLSAALDDAIGEDRENPVYALDSGIYTEDSWQAYLAIIEDAILVEADELATQDEVNAAEDAVKNALRDVLVELPKTLVELTPTADWLFWNDFDGRKGGPDMTNITAAIFSVKAGIGVDDSAGLEQKTMSDSSGTVRIPFGAQEKVHFRFYMKNDMNVPGNYLMQFFDGNDWGTTSLRLNVSNQGNIETFVGNVSLTGTATPYSQDNRGKWFCVEIAMDMTARTMSCWVDGVQTATDVALPASVLPASTKLTGVQLQVFTSGVSDPAEQYRWYDNMVVSKSYIGPMVSDYLTEPKFADLYDLIEAQIGSDFDNPVYALSAADYTSASWAGYIAAIADAVSDYNSALDAWNAAPSGQITADVDAAIASLQDAIDGLVPLKTILVDDPTGKDDWIWWDDFETDKAYKSIATRAARDDGYGAFGSRGLRIDYEGYGNEANNALASVITPPLSEVYFRYYLKMADTWPVGTPLGIFIRFNDWNHQQTGLGVNANGSWRQSWNNLTRVNPDGTALSLQPTAANLGKWVAVEVRMKLPTAAGGDGIIQVWLDGTLSWEKTNNAFTGVASFTEFDIAMFPESTLPAGAYLYYDNLVISKSPIGLASVQKETEEPEEPDADKDALTLAINAEFRQNRDGTRTNWCLTETNVTAATWPAYYDALNAALAAEADDDATQAEVDAALAALTAAKNELVEIGTLRAIIAAQYDGTALRRDMDMYEPASLIAYTTAIAQAVPVLADADASKAQVLDAMKAVTETRAALVRVWGDMKVIENPTPDWLWWDDFEDEGSMATYFDVSMPSDFFRADGKGLGGSFGMQANFAKDQVSGGSLMLAFGRTPSDYETPVAAIGEDLTEVFTRYYVRLDDDWEGGGGAKMSRVSALHKDWAQSMIAHNWSTKASGDPYDYYLSGDLAFGVDLPIGMGPGNRSGTNYLMNGVPLAGDEAVFAATLERIRMQGGTIGDGTHMITSGYNHFNYLNWFNVGRSQTPLFDSDHVGEWYCIETQTKLNTPGNADGEYRLWIDGNLEIEMTGINWIGSYVIGEGQGVGINTFFLENYWNEGSVKEQSRYFDNLVVSRTPIGQVTLVEVDEDAELLAAAKGFIGESIEIPFDGYADESAIAAKATADVNALLQATAGEAPDYSEVLATVTWTGSAYSLNLTKGTADEDYAFEVTVAPDPTVYVTGVSISPADDFSLELGGTKQLTATIEPDNATDKTVTWSSSDTTIATVDANGKVAAQAVGTATITVTTTDGAKTAACAVTVEAPAYGFIEGGFPLVTGTGADAVGIIDADFSTFGNGSVWVNGVQLQMPAQAEVRSGSVIVIIKAAYLQTLESGSYPVEVRFENGGVARTTLVVSVQAAAGHTITASADAHGGISPSGEVSVSDGNDFTFYISPDSGYIIDKLTVDGQAAKATNNTYTFKNVKADHTIHVTFKEAPSAPATGDDGSIVLWTGLLSMLAVLCLLARRKWRPIRTKGKAG